MIMKYVGTLCKDAQRRSARFELRGGIEDYLLTAQEMLAADGRFVTVSTTLYEYVSINIHVTKLQGCVYVNPNMIIKDTH
jgi:tRNA1(Val) A37 N6-methylase TrmN6